ATCGFKGIWYQKNHPFVTFMDKRKGSYSFSDGWKYHLSKDRTYKVNPDVVSDWKDAPFPDEYFDMVIFDPPHLIVDRNKKPFAMIQAYGCLYKDDYKRVLRNGIKKLFSFYNLVS
ncbi:unnamed protein product, partial [marine sediment metagenome]